MLGATLVGTRATGWRTPSTRQRTSRPSLPGCQCTSLAPACCASASTRSTTSVAYRGPAGSSEARVSVRRLEGMGGGVSVGIVLRGIVEGVLYQPCPAYIKQPMPANHGPCSYVVTILEMEGIRYEPQRHGDTEGGTAGFVDRGGHRFRDRGPSGAGTGALG